MGCGSYSSAGKIKMEKTKLKGLDEFFDDAQGLIDEIYEIKEPIEDARRELLDATEFEKIVCSNTHHATVGLVFAMCATNPAGAADVVKMKESEPFIELNKKSASGKLVMTCEAFQEYIEAIVKAKDRIEPLAEKAQSFAEKAPDLPNKAKEDIEGSTDLGMFEKVAAIKNVSMNCKSLGSVPNLVNELKMIVLNGLKEVQAASKELNDHKAKLGDIGKKCQEAKLTTPKDCYLKHGNKIEVTPALKAEWEKLMKAGEKSKKKPVRGTKK